MKNWSFTGVAAAFLLAGTAYACPDAAHADHPAAKADKVTQDKQADPKPDSRYWDPFRPHIGMVWQHPDHPSLTYNYPWASISPVDDKK